MNPQTNTSSTFARIVLLLSFACLALIFLISGTLTSSTAQSPESSTQERKLKLKGFKDIPVAIREVRNLQSDTWHKDLEIEVKNISDKPIYFMLAYLIFPDQHVSNGIAGIRLMYGDPKKAGHIDAYTDPTLDHIEPGATYVFTIPEVDRKSLEVKHKKFPGVDKNIELEFQIINFGDGTGFMGNRNRDYRGKGFTPPPPEEQNFKKIGWSISTSTAIAPQDGCGSGNCFSWYIDPEPADICWCRPVITASTRSGEPCSRLKYIWIDCDSDGNTDCYDEAIDYESSASCPGATPTPTPTPTATPRITPPPTDGHCALEFPVNCLTGIAVDKCAYTDFFGGCPASYHPSTSGVCCERDTCPSPTPAPPLCDHALQWYDAPICDWQPCVSPPTVADYDYSYSYCSAFFMVTDHYQCYWDGHCDYQYSDYEFLGIGCY